MWQECWEIDYSLGERASLSIFSVFPFVGSSLETATVSPDLLCEEARNTKPAIFDELVGQHAGTPIVLDVNPDEHVMDDLVVDLLVFAEV